MNLIARTHYLQPIAETDDLLAYAGGERIRPKDGDAFSPIQWWVKRLDDLPTVAQYALDLPYCPVMSAECERIFSGAKLVRGYQESIQLSGAYANKQTS